MEDSVLPEKSSKEKLLESSISLMSSSMGSIFRHSTNNKFKSSVLTKLQVTQPQQLEKKISDCLWTVAESKHNVVRPGANDLRKRKFATDLSNLTTISKQVEEKVETEADCFDSILWEKE